MNVCVLCVISQKVCVIYFRQQLYYSQESPSVDSGNVYTLWNEGMGKTEIHMASDAYAVVNEKLRQIGKE